MIKLSNFVCFFYFQKRMASGLTKVTMYILVSLTPDGLHTENLVNSTVIHRDLMKIMVSRDGTKVELAGNYGILFLSFYKRYIIIITAFTRQFNEGQHCI